MVESRPVHAPQAARAPLHAPFVRGQAPQRLTLVNFDARVTPPFTPSRRSNQPVTTAGRGASIARGFRSGLAARTPGTLHAGVQSGPGWP